MLLRNDCLFKGTLEFVWCHVFFSLFPFSSLFRSAHIFPSCFSLDEETFFSLSLLLNVLSFRRSLRQSRVKKNETVEQYLIEYLVVKNNGKVV